jgi:hypothetical protein
MSGFTILRAEILLKLPVDPTIDRVLRLLASGEFDEATDLPDYALGEPYPDFMLQRRLTYDGRRVVIDAEIKNKCHELENFLLWLTPAIELVERGTWYCEDGLDDEPLELSFVVDTRKFTLRGDGQERGLITGPVRPGIEK